MKKTEDAALLREFAEKGSEEAFRQLVERYSGLVYGVAMRCTGHRELAEEAAQNAFTIFARKAGQLRGEGTLAPWLHRTAFYEATKLRRAELRRIHRMNQHLDDSLPCDEPPDPWQEARPLLDEAIQELSEPDRRVLLMHYFEKLTFREIAQQLGFSAEAAQKRSSRALEKLSGSLKAKGASVTAATLAAGLTAQLAQAAPAGLSTLAATTALSAAGGSVTSAGAAGWAVSLLKSTIDFMSLTKATTAAVVLISAALPIGFQLAKNAPDPAQTSEETRSFRPGTNEQAAASPAAATGASHPAPRRINGLDLDQLARQLARLPAPEDQPEIEFRLRQLMFTLDLEQARAVAELLRSAGNVDALARIGTALFSRWAELNPEEALQTVQSMPNRIKWMALDAALLTWGTRHTDAALNWLVQAEQLPLRDVHQSVLFRQVALRDPRAAAEKGLAIGEKSLRRAGVLAALEVWARQAPIDALVWAEARGEEAQRNEFANQVISSANEKDPAAALALAQSAQNPHVRRDGTLFALLQWTQLDPGGAAQAYLNLPDPERREHTLSQMAASVARLGLDHAREFLAPIPEGQRIAALAALFPFLAGREPDAAGDLILPLAESRDHQLEFDGWVRRWLKKDPALFQRWFNQLPDSSAKQAVAAVMSGTQRGNP